MVQFGGDPLSTLLKIPGINVGVGIDSDTFGLMEEHTWDAHYAENVDPVGGSAAQLLTAGARLVEMTFTAKWSTDLPTSWSTLVYGDLPFKTVIFYLMNAAGVHQTVTIPYSKIFRHGGRHTKDQLYLCPVRILSSALPVYG
jgi:hypothetical protein